LALTGLSFRLAAGLHLATCLDLILLLVLGPSLHLVAALIGLAHPLASSTILIADFMPLLVLILILGGLAGTINTRHTTHAATHATPGPARESAGRDGGRNEDNGKKMRSFHSHTPVCD
jgi:hypothetical protein